MKKLWLIVLMASLSSGTLFAEDKGTERLANSAKVFGEIMAAPDKAIPRDLLDKADCVAIIPSMKKGGFIVGGRYGKGMISCRNKAQTAWGGTRDGDSGGRELWTSNWRGRGRCGVADHES